MDELTDIFGSVDQANSVPENNFNSFDNNSIQQNYQQQFNQAVAKQNDFSEQIVSQQQVEQPFNVEPSVISMQDLIAQEQDAPKTVVKKKKDKILITQIVLIIIWVIATVLVYNFGYDFFEPFIEV